MITLKLRKPNEKPEVNLCKVFRQAIKGYKALKEQAPQGAVVPGAAPGAIVYGVPGQFMMPPKEEKKIDLSQGIPVDVVSAPTPKAREKEQVDKTTINVSYPLIPRAPQKGEQVFAYANIKWVPAEGGIVYHLMEPQLTDNEKALLEKIKSSLVEKLDIDFTTLRKGEAKDYIKGKFEEMVNLMAAALPEEKRKQLLYYVERDFIGLEKIEPLMEDPNIEDVSADGIQIPLYIYHRDSKIGSVKTNIIFNTAEELDSFVNKLAQRCGKSISVASPLVGATLPDGSRLQITLGTDIAKRGSNFSIRKYTEKPLTPVDMIKFGSMDSKMLAYLWLGIEYGKSTLISGGTATGKTSLLNALSLFIGPDKKIVTIEDTSELKLTQAHWVPHVARQPIAEIEGRKLGEVDLFDLLRESLRQRPDFIIVGEVRGREAYVLFQQIATGHPGISTIHADTLEGLIDRLTTPPINLPASLIESLDVILFMSRIKYENIYVRKVTSVYEVLGFDREKNVPLTNEIFRWDPATDVFIAVNPSMLLKKISDQFGVTGEFLQQEMRDRAKVLDWLAEKNITNYKDFANAIRLYNAKKDRILDLMGG